jgi:hypothetical protein
MYPYIYSLLSGNSKDMIDSMAVAAAASPNPETILRNTDILKNT